MTEADREKTEGNQNSESSRREYLKMMGLAAGLGPASKTSSDDVSFFQVGDPHNHLGQTWQGDVGDGAGLLVIADPGRTGLAGTNFSTTGQAFGLRGRCDSNAGTGLRGLETSPTGLTRGVDGVTKSSGGQGVRGFADTTTGNATGVYGRTDAPEGTAVFGECRDGTGATTGLYGTTNSTNAGSAGVYGEAADQGAGVVATTNDNSFSQGALEAVNVGNGRGVDATSNSDSGVVGTTDSGFLGDAGVRGVNNGGGDGVRGLSSDRVGVYGTGSTSGVEGRHFGDPTVPNDGAGVLGTSSYGAGVTGQSFRGFGVRALGSDPTSFEPGTSALLASTRATPSSSSTGGVAIVAETESSNTSVDMRNYGSGTTIFSQAYDFSTSTWGTALYANGDVVVSQDLTVSGTKNFVQVAPNGEKVTYAAVESGDVRTEVSGVARLTDGRTTVDLPDHFGWVTDSNEDLVVTLTPYSASSPGLAVTMRTVDRIVVEELGDESGGNYKFGYEVKGIREGYADQEVVSETTDEERDELKRGGRPREEAPSVEGSLDERLEERRGREQRETEEKKAKGGDDRRPPKPPKPPMAKPGEENADPIGPPRKDGRGNNGNNDNAQTGNNGNNDNAGNN